MIKYWRYILKESWTWRYILNENWTWRYILFESWTWRYILKKNFFLPDILIWFMNLVLIYCGYIMHNLSDKKPLDRHSFETIFFFSSSTNWKQTMQMAVNHVQHLFLASVSLLSRIDGINKEKDDAKHWPCHTQAKLSVPKSAVGAYIISKYPTFIFTLMRQSFFYLVRKKNL